MSGSARPPQAGSSRWPPGEASGLDTHWLASAWAGTEAYRQTRGDGPREGSAQRRVLRTYLVARAMLGVALLLVQAAVYHLSGKVSPWLPMVCSAYALQAVAWWWVVVVRRQDARLSPGEVAGTVLVDVLAFGLMHWLDLSGGLNHAALLVLPVMMAGLLFARLPALGLVSAVSLVLLADASWRAERNSDLTALLSQAGLVGMGLFFIVLLAGQMATRLAREERSARGSLAYARQQAELNRLVIDEMSDGVLVVDAVGRVRSANPAARQLLAGGNGCPEAPFSLAMDRGWAGLLAAIHDAYARGLWPDHGLDLTLSFAQAPPHSVRVRARFTREARATDEGNAREVLAVLFMEELRTVLARQRQERLLAMGRISAGIAHEIRNPLAAVSQANALLQEDDLRPDQQRLLRIVADNVERLRRIVDDVMEAAPGSVAPSRTLDLNAEVAAICGEWARTVGLTLGPDCRLQVQMPSEAVGGIFDPDHLRRVLVNLLENALRHATDGAGAVRVVLAALDDAPWVRLSVASNGPPISAEVEAHLFEPFHSTRSRGTGLGLYICRQLCERHGGSIDYVRQPGDSHPNVFQVVMRRDGAAREGRLHLELPMADGSQP